MVLEPLCGCFKFSQKSGSGCELFLGCGRRSLESLESYVESLDVRATFTCVMFGKPHVQIRYDTRCKLLDNRCTSGGCRRFWFNSVLLK